MSTKYTTYINIDNTWALGRNNKGYMLTKDDNGDVICATLAFEYDTTNDSFVKYMDVPVNILKYAQKMLLKQVEHE